MNTPPTHLFSLPHFSLPLNKATSEVKTFKHALHPVEFNQTRIYPSRRNKKFVFSSFNLKRMLHGESPYTIEGEQNIRQLGIQAYAVPAVVEPYISDAQEAAVMKKGIELFHKNFPVDYRNFYKMHLHHLTMQDGGALIELDAARHIGKFSNVLHGTTKENKRGFSKTQSDVVFIDRQIQKLKALLYRLNKEYKTQRGLMSHGSLLLREVTKDTIHGLESSDIDRTAHGKLRKAWWKARALDFMAYAQGHPSPVEFKMATPRGGVNRQDSR